MEEEKMEDQLLPIDIHYNKLLDWLIDRRHCDPMWHTLVKGIQERISRARKTLPDTQQLAKIKERETLTYFHCLEIIEELKATEGEAKNIFGQYTSQRLKEWSEIMKLYEKNGTFLAECAQQLIRNVNYEIPALKQQISKCQQTQRECLRKEGECSANSVALRDKYETSCKDLGIAVKYAAKKTELEKAGLVRKQLNT